MADLELVHSLMVAHEIAEEGSDEAASTVEEIRAGWTDPGFDLQSDAWVVDTDDGRIVAYLEVRDLRKAVVESDGYVHPDYQDRGLGSVLLRLAEARAQAVTPALDPDQRRALTGGISAHNAAAVRLFEGLGFRPIRYFLRDEIQFAEPPQEPEWPAGISGRALREGEAIEPVYRAFREAFLDHWGDHNPSLQEWTHRWREMGLDPGLWFIAESGGAIVGISLGRMRGDQGRVGILGVLRPYRRTGLGLALLRQSFVEFYRRGVMTVDLGVDADSLTGATRLYQRAGMREVSRYAIYRKEL